jgi:aspartate-semialdehyde dehydrogenase
MSRCVAVLGATGLVGRTLLSILEEREFPLGRLRLLASDRPGRRTVRFRGEDLPVEPVAPDRFVDVDLVLSCAGNAVAERWVPIARTAGARVIDNSSAFRYHDEVPLVVPEVNGALLERRPGLVANPNCSTIGIVMALAPLRAAAGLLRVAVSTYQSVSGAGAKALAELESGVRAGLEGEVPPRAGALAPFAFNVVPHIDHFQDNGYTREEMKIVWETRKILDLPDLAVTATAVRVPVRVGHCAAVNVTFERELSVEEARSRWAAFPGLHVMDDPASARYPTALEVAGRDEVLVGRARRDLSAPRSLEFFVASDNLRKGAALNAVQIAEGMSRVEAGAW